MDSAQAIAEQTRELLNKNNLWNKQKAPEYRFYVTDVPIRFQGVGERFLGRKLTNVSVVKW